MNHTKEIEQYAQKLIFTKCIGLFLTALLLELIASFLFLKYFAFQSVEKELIDFTNRVTQELTYKNGKWDTSLYSSDPETPHPNGSSGFSSTLYIISTDGFIIERNNPIEGLLDSSDFKHVMSFQKPQTITNITNEHWRVLSKPILNKGKIVGVVMVSLYNPERFIQESADEKLLTNIDYIEKNISFDDDEISTKKIDIRNIDFDVSFEIVNTFNKVLLNNGRMPTYIDKSYVYNELKNPNKIREFRNAVDKKNYLIVSRTLFDNENNPIGIVLTGKSVDMIRDILTSASPYILIFTILIFLLVMFFISRLNRNSIKQVLEYYEEAQKKKSLPQKIFFNKQDSILKIDDKEISIPYDSNQYYLLKTIFTNTKKRFEVDELLEAFGHDISPENWRKVYDAMNLVNKKVESYIPVKLIELRDKTYQLNPQLYSATKV